jgi:non-specific serine/threonine protein kinase
MTGATRRRTAFAAAAVLCVAALVATNGCGGSDADGARAAKTGAAAPAAGARSDRWVALRAAPLKRTEVGGARIGRYIYLVGGFAERGGATTAAVERYDTRDNRWRQVRSMPIALNHAAAAAYKGALYVVGGYAASRSLSGDSAALLRYDPGRDRWTRLRDAPSRRGALAVGVIGDRLYAAGGARSGKALKTLEIYNFRTGRWSTGPPMSVAREHLAATVAGGALYVLAGRAAGQGNFATAERYLPGPARWERLPDMTRARGGIAAATVGARIVVFGGEELSEGGGTIREVELFDPVRRVWSRLPNMRTPRHGLVGAALGQRVYAVEGGPRPGLHFSSAIEALDVP